MLLAMAAMATVGEARLGRDLLATTDNDSTDIEPSQLFMIICLSIGAFVMLVALIACLVVMKRYSGAAAAEPQGPAYANGVGMVSVGNPYTQPMMMPMMMPMPAQQTKGAVPMPMMAPQPITAVSQARMASADAAEVAGVHGGADNNAMVQQMVSQAAAATDGGHGFPAHQG